MQPIFLHGGSCWENAIFTAVNYFGREYKLLLSDMFSLVINMDSIKYKKLVDRIWLKSGISIESVSKYCSIKMKCIEGIEQAPYIIEELKNHGLFLVDFDAFYCTNVPYYYNAHHSRHTFLAFEAVEQKISYLDPNIGKKIFYMSEEEFCKGIIMAWKFEPEEIANINYLAILSDSFRNIMENYDLEQVHNMKKLLLNGDDILKEFHGYEKQDYENVPFLFKLSRVGGRRNLYSQFIDFINSKSFHNDLDIISKKFKLSASKWLLVRSVIMKSIIQNNLEANIDRIATYMDEIYYLEEECLKSISNYLEGKNNISTKFIKTVKSNKKELYIDISKWCNNKGFAYEPADEIDFTLRGQFFCDKALPSIEKVKYNNINFIFPDISLAFDNIICEGQIINIPRAKYNNIYLIGAAENGSYCDYINIFNKGVLVERIQFGLTSWIHFIPSFEDIVLTSFKVYDRYINKYKEESANLYAYNVNINSNSEIDAIKLPYCENIHIIAITLIILDT